MGMVFWHCRRRDNTLTRRHLRGPAQTGFLSRFRRACRRRIQWQGGCGICAAQRSREYWAGVCAPDHRLSGSILENVGTGRIQERYFSQRAVRGIAPSARVVSTFAETSFLFAFYFPRSASEQAVAKTQSLPDPARISSMVRYEFQQAVWFEVWRRANGHLHGLTQVNAQTGLAAFELDLEQGLREIARPDWESVILRAERLMLDHTPRHGGRAVDILHVATASELAATEFLTFDANQRRIAVAEGFVAAP